LNRAGQGNKSRARAKLADSRCLSSRWANGPRGGIVALPAKGRPVRKAPKSQAPIVLKFVRCRHNKIGIMVDANLDWWSLEDLHKWAARKISFIVIDSETGEDITRILLA
jgi:hypothetical protein